MEGWVGHVGWPTADGITTKWSPVQLAVWRRIGKVRRPRPAFYPLCYTANDGTAGYLQNRLQSVLNATARLIFSRRASEHTTPLLWDLHWLRVPDPVSVVYSGISLCAWHSTGVSCRQHAADVRVCRPSPSLLWRHDYAAGAADSSSNTWRPHLSGGSGAGVEQSDSTDQGRLVAVVFPAADKGPSVSAVVQLTSDYCLSSFFF